MVRAFRKKYRRMCCKEKVKLEVSGCCSIGSPKLKWEDAKVL